MKNEDNEADNQLQFCNDPRGTTTHKETKLIKDYKIVNIKCRMIIFDLNIQMKYFGGGNWFL